MSNLEKYGASERFIIEATLYPEYYLGRIISQSKDMYSVATETGIHLAEVSGKFRFNTNGIADFPVVGDFVMLDRNESTEGNLIIHNILTRKSAFERKAVGLNGQTQIVAANIDIVFICMSLNKDYNLSRIERYLSIAWESRATPIIVLTKSDLCSDLAQALCEISSIAIGTDIIITSSYDEQSYMKLLPYLKKGITASFIGSSGVGKSTLINCLAGENLLSTSEIGNDDKGRHTTTRRELLVLPQGCIVIDTPGMREIGIESANLAKSFADIDLLASRCRFSDCTHKNEPGCAVRQAIEAGTLDMRRFANYQKLQKEASYDGLNSKQIETEKLNTMFKDVGGMKKAKNYCKQVTKRKGGR